MSRSSRVFRANLVVLVASFAAGTLPALVYLRQDGFSEAAFETVLRLGARISFVVFLLAFVARPLRRLVDTGATRRLLANRRLIGVSFAGLMSAHLLFLLWHNGPIVAPGGMLIYAFIYLMLITSFAGPAAALGARRWKILHKTGLYAVAIAFAVTIVGGVKESGGTGYLAFAALLTAAIALRIGAFLARRSGSVRG